MSSFANNTGHLLIGCDFINHWDSSSDADIKHISGILKSASLIQHVQLCTQIHGHIVGLVIYRKYDIFVKKVSVTSIYSGDFLINIEVSLRESSVPTRTAKNHT